MTHDCPPASQPACSSNHSTSVKLCNPISTVFRERNISPTGTISSWHFGVRWTGRALARHLPHLVGSNSVSHRLKLPLAGRFCRRRFDEPPTTATGARVPRGWAEIRCNELGGFFFVALLFRLFCCSFSISCWWALRGHLFWMWWTSWWSFNWLKKNLRRYPTGPGSTNLDNGRKLFAIRLDSWWVLRSLVTLKHCLIEKELFDVTWKKFEVKKK